MIELVKYSKEKDLLCKLIRRFWIAHNGYTQTGDETLDNCLAWTADGHEVYLIHKDGMAIGFVHLASRGCEIDWLEDLFILPEYQGKGFGTEAIRLTEEIVKAYSDSLYMEVAARNGRALKLYHRIGYNTLNTVTIRKDFQPDKYQTTGRETILGHVFEVKDYA